MAPGDKAEEQEDDQAALRRGLAAFEKGQQARGGFASKLRYHVEALGFFVSVLKTCKDEGIVGFLEQEMRTLACLVVDESKVVLHEARESGVDFVEQDGSAKAEIGFKAARSALVELGQRGSHEVLESALATCDAHIDEIQLSRCVDEFEEDVLVVEPAMLPPPPSKPPLVVYPDLPVPPPSSLPVPPPGKHSQSDGATRASVVRRGNLTDVEVQVLRCSSKIHGRLFMPWVNDLDAMLDQELLSLTKVWRDDKGPDMSERQKRKHATWRRPADILQELGRSAGDLKLTMIAEGGIDPSSITQHAVGDCSFVASLCIAAEFEQRRGEPLVTSLIHPQCSRTRRPIYNPSGKYVVKLWANGCYRKVEVDDRLPMDGSRTALCSSSNRPGELWVSIIEKAYMKLHGSYDFPGSNSGMDLFALTGWLPEEIYFDDFSGSSPPNPVRDRSSEAKLEKVWKVLYNAKNHFGDCLLTAATGPKDEQQAHLGLVPEHAYAVLDLFEQEQNGLRLLKLKNPWGKQRWRGNYGVNDTLHWTSSLQQETGYDRSAAAAADDGIFWIDWKSLKSSFAALYVNWKPGPLRYKTSLHAVWPAEDGPENDTFYMGLNKQYSLWVPPATGTGIIWVLLTRHVHADKGTDASTTEADALAMHLFEGAGRVYNMTYSRPFLQGIYSSNHTLLQLHLPDQFGPAPLEYTLVISQFRKKRDVSFTLLAHGSCAFTITEAPEPPRLRDKGVGSWVCGKGSTSRVCAGGRLGKPDFVHNPQYRLVLSAATRLHLELFAPKEISIGMHLVPGGQRVDGTAIKAAGSAARSSGYDGAGFCYLPRREGDAASLKFKPGPYTVVLCTRRANTEGKFLLRVHSDEPLGALLTPIPAEGSGMHAQSFLGKFKGVATETYRGQLPPNSACFAFVQASSALVTVRARVPEQLRVDLKVLLVQFSADGKVVTSASPLAESPWTDEACGAAICNFKLPCPQGDTRYGVMLAAEPLASNSFSMSVYTKPKLRCFQI